MNNSNYSTTINAATTKTRFSCLQSQPQQTNNVFGYAAATTTASSSNTATISTKQKPKANLLDLNLINNDLLIITIR